MDLNMYSRKEVGQEKSNYSLRFLVRAAIAVELGSIILLNN